MIKFCEDNQDKKVDLEKAKAGDTFRFKHSGNLWYLVILGDTMGRNKTGGVLVFRHPSTELAPYISTLDLCRNLQELVKVNLCLKEID